MSRFAATIATWAAFCALVAVLAWWAWQLLGPAVVHVAPAGPKDPTATLVASGLFGGGTPTQSTAAPQSPLAEGDARLLGIIAEPRQQGYAVFRLASGPKVVVAGEEITPGMMLRTVAPDAITVREGAVERQIWLRPDANAGMAAAPAPQATRAAANGAGTAAASADSCAAPAGFGGSVIRLNAELLAGLRSDTAAWRALLAATPEGLVVTQNGGYAAMLGLRVGDRIARANGIALRNPDDIAAAVLRPLAENQGVRISGTRQGSPQELWLANAACSG